MRLLSLVIVTAPLFLAATGCASFGNDRVAVLERENQRLSVELAAAEQNNENLRTQLEQYVRQLTAAELQQEVTRRVQNECEKNRTTAPHFKAAQAAAEANQAWTEHAAAQQLVAEMEKAVQQLRTRITQLERNPTVQPTNTPVPPKNAQPQRQPRRTTGPAVMSKTVEGTKNPTPSRKLYNRVKRIKHPDTPQPEGADISYNME